MIHTWQAEFAKGQSGEDEIDAFFKQWYTVKPVSLRTEKEKGIDRIYTRPDGTDVAVEIKSDYRTINTGNIFLETDVSGKLGWAYKTVADIILYGIFGSTGLRRVHIIPNKFLKDNMPHFEIKYRKVPVFNMTYKAEGLLVPEFVLGCTICHL